MTINLTDELASACMKAREHGRTPKSGHIVVDAYQARALGDPDITALHVIGELLDRIAELAKEDA